MYYFPLKGKENMHRIILYQYQQSLNLHLIIITLFFPLNKNQETVQDPTNMMSASITIYFEYNCLDIM